MADELNISGVGPGHVVPGPKPVAGLPDAGKDSSFKDMLVSSLEEVRNLQTDADTAIKSLVAGEVTDVTEAIVKVEKADIAFNKMMQIRNKIVQAYEEVMRMNV